MDPLVAIVDADACTACGTCLTACPYDAISMSAGAGISMSAGADGREVAVISETGCKGCGGCVPVCPDDAIDLLGYTDAQVRAQIDSLLEVAVA
jgi:heterodisulfide reductase subunit A